MQKGTTVTIKCVCCGKEYESATYNSCYCEDCRVIVRAKYASYRNYCRSRDIKPQSGLVFRKFYKRYGGEGLLIDNEALIDILEDIATGVTRNVNKALREDVIRATQLGLSYGQYASFVRDIHK